MKASDFVARAAGTLSVDPAEEARLYALYHRPRYLALLDLMERYAPDGSRILDVGPSPLTQLVADRFGRPVDTMGLEAEGETPTGHHYHLDLARAGDLADRPPVDARWPAIIFAEVLEHLPVSPRLVLGLLRSFLAPDGHLIVQTPNAVSLEHRVKMLLGRNPFELIREQKGNPGHFREYTLRELHAYAEASGLEVVHASYGSYFDARFAHHAAGVNLRPFEAPLRNAVNRYSPPSLKPGITMVMTPA